MVDNAWALRDGLEDLRVRGRRPQEPRIPHAQLDAPGVRDGKIVTPIVPILVGDDWKAVSAAVGRAPFDAGVVANTALPPRSPVAALLRTSVMATHDRATIDRSLGPSERVKKSFQASTDLLPGPARCTISPFPGAKKEFGRTVVTLRGRSRNARSERRLR